MDRRYYDCGTSGKTKKAGGGIRKSLQAWREVALFNAQTALERFEAALERSEKLKAAGLRSRSNPRRQKVKGNTRRAHYTKAQPLQIQGHTRVRR